MPLEFALRPRIRLDEHAATPRRRELPPLVLPVAAYWLGIAALTYKLVHAAPGENAGVPSVAPATEPLSQRRELAPRAMAEPRAPSPQAFGPLPSLDREDREDREPEPARSEPAPARVSTVSVLPREPVPPLRKTVEPKVPFVSVARKSESPSYEPAPEPHRWLFEPPPAAPRREPSASSAAREPRKEIDDAGPALPTCEVVAAAANQEVDLRSSRQAPDLSREALAGVLENGAYLTACSVPDRTTLDICVAVQEGTVKGVTVVTRPADAGLATCIRRAVARLRFPYGPRLDITRTRFDAAR
jgi:hypothetical protein